MSLIEDIKSALRMASSASDKLSSFNTHSVARSAQDQSFMFPCMISDTVPVDMATTVARNLDRVYASWTQIYLSSIGFIDLDYIKNPRQFIARYQPKFEESTEDGFEETAMDELKDVLYGDDEVLFSGSRNGQSVIGYCGPGEQSGMVSLAVKAGKKPYMEGYNLGGIGNTSGISVMMEGPDTDLLVDAMIKSSQRTMNDEHLRATQSSSAPRLGLNDVKKLNDMQPYVLELKLLATKGNSSMSQWVNYQIGVKTYLHLGNSKVLNASIVDALKNRNPAFNFIRWTTGEISLVKDILLHLDDINFDVANKSSRTGKFISRLREMKKKYINISSGGASRIPPVATIVISSSDYQHIKSDYGFDLKNMVFASKLMSSLFLMSFVILDDVTKTIDILVDGQHDYQTYSLETLEREVTLNSNKLGKELTRMLGTN